MEKSFGFGWNLFNNLHQHIRYLCRASYEAYFLLFQIITVVEIFCIGKVSWVFCWPFVDMFMLQIFVDIFVEANIFVVLWTNWYHDFERCFYTFISIKKIYNFYTAFRWHQDNDSKSFCCSMNKFDTKFLNVFFINLLTNWYLYSSIMYIDIYRSFLVKEKNIRECSNLSWEQGLVEICYN